MNTLFYRTKIRTLAVLLLAFLAAAAVTFGVLQIRSWRVSHLPTNTVSTRSDEERLRILASLAASSTPTVEERSVILDTLSSGSSDTTGPTNEEKLKTLQVLQP